MDIGDREAIVLPDREVVTRYLELPSVRLGVPLLPHLQPAEQAQVGVDLAVVIQRVAGAPVGGVEGRPSRDRGAGDLRDRATLPFGIQVAVRRGERQVGI